MKRSMLGIACILLVSIISFLPETIPRVTADLVTEDVEFNYFLPDQEDIVAGSLVVFGFGAFNRGAFFPYPFSESVSTSLEVHVSGGRILTDSSIVQFMKFSFDTLKPSNEFSATFEKTSLDVHSGALGYLLLQVDETATSLDLQLTPSWTDWKGTHAGPPDALGFQVLQRQSSDPLVTIARDRKALFTSLKNVDEFLETGSYKSTDLMADVGSFLFKQIEKALADYDAEGEIIWWTGSEALGGLVPILSSFDEAKEAFIMAYAFVALEVYDIYSRESFMIDFMACRLAGICGPGGIIGDLAALIGLTDQEIDHRLQGTYSKAASDLNQERQMCDHLVQESLWFKNECPKVLGCDTTYIKFMELLSKESEKQRDLIDKEIQYFASFGPPKTPMVNAIVGLSTPDGGTIIVDSSKYSGSASTLIAVGVHQIRALAPVGMMFKEWQFTGGVTVPSPNAYSTTVEVNGPGTLAAVFTTSPPPISPIQLILTLVTYSLGGPIEHQNDVPVIRYGDAICWKGSAPMELAGKDVAALVSRDNGNTWELGAGSSTIDSQGNFYICPGGALPFAARPAPYLTYAEVGPNWRVSPIRSWIVLPSPVSISDLSASSSVPFGGSINVIAKITGEGGLEGTDRIAGGNWTLEYSRDGQTWGTLAEGVVSAKQLSNSPTNPGTSPYGFQYSLNTGVTATFSGITFLRLSYSGDQNYLGTMSDYVTVTVAEPPPLFQPSTYTVLLLSSTANETNFGSIIVDGNTTALPKEVDLVPGDHAVTASDVSGQEFLGWETTGGIAALNPTSQTTRVTINNTGGIVAHYAPQAVVTTSTTTVFSPTYTVTKVLTENVTATSTTTTTSWTTWTQFVTLLNGTTTETVTSWNTTTSFSPTITQIVTEHVTVFSVCPVTATQTTLTPLSSFVVVTITTPTTVTVYSYFTNTLWTSTATTVSRTSTTNSTITMPATTEVITEKELTTVFQPTWTTTTTTQTDQVRAENCPLLPSSISLRFSPNTVNVSSSPNTVHIDGTLNPPLAGETIFLSYAPSGNGPWAALASVQTGAEGKFSYDWTVIEQASYPQQFYLRASWAGNEQYSGTETTSLPLSPPYVTVVREFDPAAAVGVAASVVLFFGLATRRKRRHLPHESTLTRLNKPDPSDGDP
jgi:hypothetical protein